MTVPTTNPPATTPARPASATLFDLPTLDFNAPVATRQQIALRNPHRDKMALLDAVLWTSADFKRGVALWRVQPSEFWVPGHFPDRPLLPGVLQVEAGAQLSVFLYNSRFVKPKLCAFTHITDCSFRGQVMPGDDFLLLADEIRASERRFTSYIQGIAKNKIAFTATIEGISIGEAKI